jgi:hypothetical protein
MAGSISKKLRGLNAKNRAYLELLLNGGGLRVDSKETQGLFNKSAEANWYLLIWATGSRSDGSERSGTRDLISRGSRIGQLGLVGRAGRRRGNAGDQISSRRGSGSSEFHRNRCSGGQINRALGLA